MAIRRHTAPTGQPTAAPHVFKPRATLGKFTKFFPLFYAACGVVMAGCLAAAYFLNMWLIPLMAAIPMASVIATGLYASKMQNQRVVIDHQGLRVLQGKQPTLALTWKSITRLTIRDVQGGNMYELWVRKEASPLMADFFEDSDKLLAAISARAELPWERLEDE